MESQSAEHKARRRIGFVNGHGSATRQKIIALKEVTLKYSYRLKQIDNDGQFEYSKTIEVDFGAPKKHCNSSESI